MENRIRCEVEGYEDKFFQVGQKWKTNCKKIVTITELDFKAKTWKVLYDGAYWVSTEGRYTLGDFSDEDLVELIEDVSQDSNKELQPEPKTEYFVFVQNKNPPKVAHLTLDSAKTEAIRLSEKEIGREVSIMTKVKSYKSEVIVKEILC